MVARQRMLWLSKKWYKQVLYIIASKAQMLYKLPKLIIVPLFCSGRETYKWIYTVDYTPIFIKSVWIILKGV